MNNYQLYRTDVKLSGQVAWNLVLQSDKKGKLEVSYFDLSPISSYVDYKYNQNRECLKYTHQENLRTLYKEIKGQFYESCINPQLKTIYPIIKPSSDRVQTYDNELDMGCSRISYDRYRKQLHYLCPLWLEDFSTTKTLSFKISINSKTGETLSSKILTITKNGSSYNDSFVDYFNSYVKSLCLDKDVIGNELLDIDIKNDNASIQGVDIISGDVTTKNISNIIPNLLSRERPLMETDFLLIDNYHTSQMICKQLFNFNLVFDISDIVSPIVDLQLKDKQIYITVDVYCQDETGKELNENNLLVRKGFSTDYNENPMIKKVLSYLKDYNYVKTIHTNKLSPDICHWTLSDNESYIFNLYDGFGYKYNMFYKDAPNYWETDVTTYPNAITWCSFCPEAENVPNDSISNIELNYISFVDRRTIFNPDSTFFKLTRFDNSELKKDLPKEFLMNAIINNRSTEQSFTQDYINVASFGSSFYSFIVVKKDRNIMDWPENESEDYPISIYLPEYIYSNLPNELKNKDWYRSFDNIGSYDDSDFSKYVILKSMSLNHHFLFMVHNNHKELLSYKFISKLIDFMDIRIFNNTGFETIKSIFSKVIEPDILCINGSLKYTYVSSPSTVSDEIEYIKNTNGVKIIRYDGKIKPRFVDFEDIVHYQVKQCTIEEYKSSDEYAVFNTIDNRKFLPYYPSLNYYNIQTFTEPIRYNEYKWYVDNLIYNLGPNIETKIYSKDNEETYYSNEELIRIVLKRYYPYLTVDHYDYIRSLYNADVSYEYDTPAWNPDWNNNEGRFEYVYTIKLKLK